MNLDPKQIRTSLERLRSIDTDYRYFGVDTHRYRLADMLTNSELEQIESDYNISLPDEYRIFLTTIGNGGAGPGYGLQRFGFVPSISSIPRATHRGALRIVHQTPNYQKLVHDLFDDSGNLIDPMDVSFYASIESLANDGYRGPTALSYPFCTEVSCAGSTNTPEQEMDVDITRGALQLADYGCAMSAYLILNGEHRGEVWFYEPGFYFIPFAETANIHYPDSSEVTDSDRKTTFTFDIWYNHWLEHAIQQCLAEYGQS